MSDFSSCESPPSSFQSAGRIRLGVAKLKIFDGRLYNMYSHIIRIYFLRDRRAYVCQQTCGMQEQRGRPRRRKYRFPLVQHFDWRDFEADERGAAARSRSDHTHSSEKGGEEGKERDGAS